MTKLSLLVIESLLKEAAPAWVQAIQKGLLSAGNINRVAQSMPNGAFRTIGQLGHGAMNTAEKVVGNVGGNAGEMVRKLPLNPSIPLQKYYQPLVNASQAAEKIAPGVTAPYIAATPRGIFQQHAGPANVIPPGVTAPTWQQNIKDKLAPHGFTDMHPENFSQGGKLFDFQAPQYGGAAAGGQIFNQKAIAKASPQFASLMQGAVKAPTPALREQSFNQATALVPKLPHRFYDAPAKGVPAIPTPAPAPAPTIGKPGTIGTAGGLQGLSKVAIDCLRSGNVQPANNDHQS